MFVARDRPRQHFKALGLYGASRRASTDMYVPPESSFIAAFAIAAAPTIMASYPQWWKPLHS
jgi:hypothetical protein